MPRQASALPISPVTLERAVLSGPAFRPRHERSLLGGSPGGSSRKDLEAQMLSSRRKRCRSLCVILQMQGAAGLRNGSPRDPVQRILWVVPGTDHERKSRIRGYPFGIRGTGDFTRRLETGGFRASEEPAPHPELSGDAFRFCRVRMSLSGGKAEELSEHSNKFLLQRIFSVWRYKNDNLRHKNICPGENSSFLIFSLPS